MISNFPNNISYKKKDPNLFIYFLLFEIKKNKNKENWKLEWYMVYNHWFIDVKGKVCEKNEITFYFLKFSLYDKKSNEIP